MSLSHGLIDQSLTEAFVDAGPVMVKYLNDHTPTNFRSTPQFPDYHAEFPGGKTMGGRSLDTPPYSFKELGKWADRVTPSPYYPDPRLSIYDTPLGQAVPAPKAAMMKPQSLAPPITSRVMAGPIKANKASSPITRMVNWKTMVQSQV